MPAHSSPEYIREWRRRNPERHRAHAQSYRQRHADAIRAREAVRLAIERGELEVPEQCPACGDEPGRDSRGRRLIEAHHDDYARPLDVSWLCRPCHLAEHRSAA